ncbi:hypothetical protein LguiB_004211 [Lonicera macranthoides]
MMNQSQTTQSSPQPQPSSLVSSVKFLFAISIASSTLGLAFLSETNFYNTHFSKFGNFFLCQLCSVIFTLHFILFLSHKPIRNARLLRGPISKFTATAASFTFNFFLYLVPEQSLTGLLFVLCLWIDVVAIIQIIRPSLDLKLVHLILMVIVTRAISLYDFTSRTLLVLFFCFLVLYARYFLEEADTIQEKGKTTRKLGEIIC